MTTNTQTVYVLTHADIGLIEDGKAHENFEDKLTAPSIFATWKAAVKAAESEFAKIWHDQTEDTEDEGRPSPSLEWTASDDARKMDAHYEDFGITWRITAVPLHD